MTTVRELMIGIGFDVDEAKLKQLEDGLKTIKKPKVVKIDLDNTSTATGFLERAKTLIPFVGRELDALGPKIAAAAAGMFGMAAAAMFGRELVTTIATFEKLRAQLVTIEKDEAVAEKAFQNLKTFAATTPFEFSNVTDSFIRLRAVGLAPTMDDMTAMGDVAAGMGKDITEFADAIVGATTGEMERLKAFGITASQQGKKVTFSFKGVKTVVKKEAGEISKYLYDLGRREFAGGMERQSKTMAGAFSNLKDNIAAFLFSVGENGFTSELTLFIKELTGATGEADSLAVILGRVLGFAVRQLRDAFKFAKDNAGALTIALGALMAVMAVHTVNAFIRAIVAMGASFMASTGPVLIAVLALGLLALAVEDIIGFFNGKESVIGIWLEDTFGVTGPEAVDKLVTGLQILVAVLGLLLVAFSAPFALIGTLIALATIIILEWEKIPGAFANMFDQIGQIFEQFYNYVKDSWVGWIGSMVMELVAFGASIYTSLSDAWDRSIDYMANAFAEFIIGIGQKIMGIPEMLKDLPGIGTALSVGGNVAEFIGGGAASPAIDANRRINEVSNNRSVKTTSISAPITVNVSGSDPGVVSSIEQQLSQAMANMFDRAASDLDGATE